MIEKIKLYFYAVRNLTFKQTAGRVFAQIKRRFKLYRIPKTPNNLAGEIESRIPFNEYDPWNNKEDILKGIFNFSYEKNELGNPINWNPKFMSDSCRLQIHFFNFLYLINDAQKIDLIHGWIRQNKTGDEISWHPYSISLRIFSWMRANLNDPVIDESIYRQAAFLYRNNEFYIPANHYLENARALIFAGLYFDKNGESSKWLSKGLKIITQALTKQVEADGAYYEKSPMYHNIAVQIFVDILNVLPKTFDEYNEIYSTVEKMADFLKSILHPDGKFAQFSDSSLEMGNPPNVILNYTFEVTGYKAKFKNTFETSGHYIFKNETIYLALDAGSMADRRMSGHTHADIFNYELSFNSKRFIVDTGTGTYHPTKERDVMRSTRAHNTLCIDGKSQAELWNSFRVGRFFDPKNIKWNINENGFIFEGEFDGYSKLIGDSLIHKRFMRFENNRLKIEDQVRGENHHLVESMVHLHPSVNIIDKGGKILILKSEESIAQFEVLEGEFKVEDSVYYPEMGLGIPNKSIVIFANSAPPINLSYLINFSPQSK
ncbi:MAG: alginate lyase family protein [Ignavibacteriae bacterium]|nr:hypothetical protein [Ignavibacteriota bacterium]NOG98221.1 alginate lyase family protein [Ignavibacteriota bacterium]